MIIQLIGKIKKYDDSETVMPKIMTSICA